jgi:leader peptidase (prepilin peptidase)/N-methyltransferase
VAGAAAGALLGAGVLLAVWLAWYLVRHEEGMGLGDVKMLAVIGAFLGWKGVLVALFIAALSGAAVGLTLMAWGSLGAKSKLPFGAFLAFGGLVALFVGEPLVRAYARLL